MSSNIFGKIITDIVAIGLTIASDTITAGATTGLSPLIATGIRIGVGTTINQTYDAILNQNFDAKEFGKNLAFASISVGTAKVMRNVEERVVQGLGQDGMEKTLGRLSSMKTGAGETLNKPLTSLQRLVKKVKTMKAKQDMSLGIANDIDDVSEIQMQELKMSSDFQMLSENEQDKVEKYIKGNEDEQSVNEKNNDDGIDEDNKPIRVQIMLKPDHRPQIKASKMLKLKIDEKRKKKKLTSDYQNKTGQFKPFDWGNK